MNTRICILIVGSLAALAGCGPNPYVSQQIDELHRVRRDLEDMVYELQYENQQYAQELEACRQRGQSGDGSGGTGGPRIIAPPLGDDGPGITPPSVEYGKPTLPDTEQGGMRKVHPDELDDDLSVPDELPQPRGASRRPDGTDDVEAEPTDTRVTHVVIIPDRTHGRNFDGRLGDDGVTVVVEPRNADDRFVPRPGAVSVVVLDPAQEGDQARVARWDLDADEIGYRLRVGSRTSRGIDLKLPWPDKPPAHGDLHVFVRYETDDGRKLEVDGPLVVTLPGQVSQRWTPRPAASSTPRPATSTASRSTFSITPRTSIAEIAPVGTAPVGTGVLSRRGDNATSDDSASAPRELPRNTGTVPAIPAGDAVLSGTPRMAPTPASSSGGQPATSGGAPRRPTWQPYR